MPWTDVFFRVMTWILAILAIAGVLSLVEWLANG